MVGEAVHVDGCEMIKIGAKNVLNGAITKMVFAGHDVVAVAFRVESHCQGMIKWLK